METIVITGGHHNSALVMANELQSKGFRVVWFGHRHAARGDRNDSAEYQEVTDSGIPFHELQAGKISSPLRITEVIKIPFGVLHAAYLLLKTRPAGVVTFGGYLGLAAAVAAFCLGIPVYLHEQTIVGGKANRMTARFAKKIYLTWNSSLRYFPPQKTLVVGLPLRPGILNAKPKKFFKQSRPTILVMGGKQGSHVMNMAIFSALTQLTKQYNVIHQTGMSSATGDYERASKLRSAYYLPQGYIGQDEIGQYFASADLVISRSGAHTAYELAVLGKRSILIPFMYTTGAEQLEQARLLSAAGIAAIVLEADLTRKTLIAAIADAIKLPTPVPLSLPRDAATLLTSDLLTELK